MDEVVTPDKNVAKERVVPAQQIASCGDVSCEFLVDPVPRPRPKPFKLNLKPEKREVVFITNQKPNAPQIIELAAKMLRERGIAVKEKAYYKHDGTVQGEVLTQLKQERGLILSGVND
jgi:hypothetical protein